MRLRIENLCCSIGKKCLLEAINTDVHSGEIMGIIGPNGAGKSTLLKHIAGILPCKTIFLDEKELSTLSVRERAKEIAYLSQFATTPSMSVLEVLELGRRAYSGMLLTHKDKALMDESIHHFNLAPLLERNIATLSGGERQKVLIAGALLQEPKVLLLDEPISHLDPKNQLEMLLAMRHVTQHKALITLIVLHDMQHAIHYTHRLLMLKKGRIIHDTPTKEVEASMLQTLFDVQTSLHVNNGHTFVYYEHHHDETHLKHHH
ncbi:ABC transporter ATP-binding protein [Sulfurospirillum barnesii]|uniref:ABC-type cobalamin/Fe3+-siderophore transport system, ATPase component n=1 Tax=Sulfurospirillum barnesii (strain ATCC 700032 / DSM 10660 / SES-3) TaxID=760154 RepID=I3XZV9_SULBS|nr:ABC transporter ATP-binding protein [Sulfurospirillum barnesii]AFL69483.1 ABC-type cobalamin/Fe3+-siderophore transport system, ATPase component [Sulfurospirillum barnesii SES-3]